MAVKLMLRKREEIFTTPNLTNLQVRDHIKIFSLLIAKHAKNNELLDYILYYFEEIKPRYNNFLYKYIIFIIMKDYVIM